MCLFSGTLSPDLGTVFSGLPTVSPRLRTAFPDLGTVTLNLSKSSSTFGQAVSRLPGRIEAHQEPHQPPL